jgi:dTDP-glucose 4,6-dehydratase
MCPRSAYAQAKRLAETLCMAATQDGVLPAMVARLFAFVGPRIPLDARFAVGNFLRDALKGQTIAVLGDGRARRSYLYAADLPEWCWALLVRGRPGVAYNVGATDPVTIEELARRVGRLPSPPVGVQLLGTPDDGPPPWYVPSTARAAEEFGLRPRTDLEAALRKTYNWLASRQANTR